MKKLIFFICMFLCIISHTYAAETFYQVKVKTYMYSRLSIKSPKVHYTGAYGTSIHDVFVAEKGLVVVGGKVKNGFMHVSEASNWCQFDSGWIRVNLIRKMKKCRACNGTGRTNNICKECDGVGVHACCDYTGKEACHKCRGVGAI